ncbi:MAG TPA: LPS assembly protein LptD [Stellaceae bacterium]|nr:LPS assembly protein LptD [Stellaceae bacterium]
MRRIAAGFIAAALVLCIAGAAAFAQLGFQGDRQKTNKNAPVVFQADEVQYDDEHGLTIAKGHVEISQNDQVLLADTVSYNRHTDTVTAAGHVSLLTPTGEVVFSDFMELRDSMGTGFAQNVRMLLADRSRLAANTARRLNGKVLELRRGIYSPCDLCKNDPTAPPAWDFKAREIRHDKEQKIIEFQDVTLDIDGIPVFYSPYLSEPDPSVKRATGFLTPSFGNSTNLGVHLTVPYFLVLGPDKDLTLSPRITTRAGPIMASEYRQRFSNGELDAIGSLNYSNLGSGNVTDTGSQIRGHINASGILDLDPTYRTGLQIQRASDQTYLLRFGFGNPLLNALISRAYLEGFQPRAETDVNAYIFQPLLPGLGDQTQPIVLPVVNRNWQSEPDPWGGVTHLNANLLNIVRETGTQTRRLSMGALWDKTFRDGIGGQYKFTASLRGDAYSINNLSPKSNPELPSAYFSVNGAPPTDPIRTTFLAGRAFPQVGLQWSYPLVHRSETMNALIEPITAVYVGPSGGNQRKIPDEDSLGFELHDTDLFRPDRLSGYDILDTGQRVDYGLKGGLYNDTGGSYRFLIGQSYRAEPNPFLPPGSGADQRLSDVVGRVVLSPASYLDMIYRFRLDRATLANKTQEVAVNGGPQSFRVGAAFLLIPPQQLNQVVTNPATGQTVLLGKREQLSVNATARLTQYWSLSGSETINLANSTNLVNGIATPQSNNTSLYATLSAIYQDECMAFIGSVTQSGIRSGDVTPGVSVLFSVVFKNLGEIGGTVASFAGTGTP